MSTRRVSRNKRQQPRVMTRGMRAAIRGMIDGQIEHKTFTVLAGSSPSTVVGTLFTITQSIVEGSDVNQRDGDMIIVKNVSLRLSFSAGAASKTIQRMIVFQDNMAQGGVPAVTDLLDSASYLSGYAPTNVQRGRFKVLYDKYVVLVDGADNAEQAKELSFNMSHKVFYSAPTSVAGANGKGAIFIIFIADNGLGTYSLNYEVVYTDA